MSEDPNDECEFGVDNCGNAPYYTELPGHRWVTEGGRPMPMDESYDNPSATEERPDYWIGYENDVELTTAEYWVCWDCAQRIVPHVIEELPV